MILHWIQFQIKAKDCLNNLRDVFWLQIFPRRRLKPQRWIWASRRCSTPKSWSPQRPRTLWGSSPTFPGTTASSPGRLVVCSSPSRCFCLQLLAGKECLGITKHFCSSTELCFRQLTRLLSTNPWLLSICCMETFFLDFAAGLASLGSSHVPEVELLSRTKTPDGQKDEEVTCTQACSKHVYVQLLHSLPLGFRTPPARNRSSHWPSSARPRPECEPSATCAWNPSTSSRDVC